MKEKTDQKKIAIIVFSNELDKLLAAFHIATGAAALGAETTIFFTFWGLTTLKQEGAKAEGKSFVDKMFSFMLPKSPVRFKLSKMNIFGLGTIMMKKIMKEKNQSSLDSLIDLARKTGVKFVACRSSMEMMGVKKEELIDSIEIGDVTSYLEISLNSTINLFI